MTTRKGFFTALAAALAATWARAQSIIITPCRPKLVWEGQPALCNGQCPQPDCGYRAPGFPAVAANWEEYAKYAQLGEVYWGNAAAVPIVLIKRLNRCPNCNTAFWQDPDKE